ncbi:MAG: alpha-hydroxy acid oxidase [Lachnospiraceae bacterium]|nr:alpha-hydroxy acid oxidase [Lachnospiraceae bacterium]
MEKAVREKAMDTNQITREYFDEILLEMRHIDGVRPDTALTLYGKTFKTPVMMAALSHLRGKGGEGDGMVQMAEGAKLAGAVNWAGMGPNEQYADIAAVGTPTIRIIKPYEDETLVLSAIEQAEELGALAVGMDLDHSFNSKGEYDNVLGYPMRPRSLKEIEGYCRRTKLPFVVKGVLSAVDAKKCLEAGVRGIVISHHHGILPTVVPPLMVLPEIAEVIDGRIPIFVDCGIMNGTDVFKALALGATAVSVGRPVMSAILENGARGAADTIGAVTKELAGAMARTCSPDIRHIDRSLLWRRNGTRL